MLGRRRMLRGETRMIQKEKFKKEEMRETRGKEEEWQFEKGRLLGKRRMPGGETRIVERKVNRGRNAMDEEKLIKNEW